MTFVDVAAAIIRDASGRYLIARRRPGSHLAGMWEFPGGKRHAGETLEECLRRELHEELGATFDVGERVDTVEWTYDETTITLAFFRCEHTAGAIEPREAPAIAWVAPERLAEYEFPPADRALIDRLRGAA